MTQASSTGYIDRLRARYPYVSHLRQMYRFEGELKQATKRATFIYVVASGPIRMLLPWSVRRGVVLTPLQWHQFIKAEGETIFRESVLETHNIRHGVHYQTVSFLGWFTEGANKNALGQSDYSDAPAKRRTTRKTKRAG